MTKLRWKIFFTIISCCSIAVVILGLLSIRQSIVLTEKKENEMLLWMTRYYSAEFNKPFEAIESQVDELALYLTHTIDFERLKTDRNYLAEYENELAPFVRQFAQERTDGIAGWVYFDPGWSDAPHDIYYVDGDGDGLPDRQAHVPFSYYTSPTTETDDKYWWRGPIAAREGVWTNPYEWTLVNNEVIKVVSYAQPVYIEDQLIAVVGTYYRFDELSQRIRDIRVYESGFATLYNEELDVVIHPSYFAGTRETSDNLSTVENGLFRSVCEQITSLPYGVIPFSGEGENRAFAFCRLSNGWMLGITPSAAEMFAYLPRMLVILLFAILLSLLLSAGAAMLLGQRFARPILRLSKAAQRIGEGDFSVRVAVNTNDEVKTLADSFNRMADSVQALQSELEHQAYYDELTGARNLAKFKLDAHALLSRMPGQPFTLIKIDICEFKLLNDLCGFLEGDRILSCIAQLLGCLLDPARELFARINADEFILLLATNDSDLLNRRHADFEARLAKAGEGLSFRFVVATGRYAVPSGEIDMTAFFERVNLAHRLAKQSPLPKIRDYDDKARALVLREREIEAMQEEALANEEFSLYLQPKYRLSDETIVGAEGLVRWKSPKLGMVYPNDFIPLFEKNGFIIHLDLLMFEMTCRTIRGWLDTGVAPVVVSINFSRIHLGNPSLVSSLCEIADRYQIPHPLLEVELTETAMFDHGDLLVEFSHKLHQAGFLLAMDDFGTGYSSLGLLKNLPVDVLKLDRSFFVEAIDEKRQQAIISSIIDMAKRLEIKTVAEGVEEQVQIDLLRTLGCDQVQGYYYAKPMPVEEFNDRLGAR